MPDPTSLSLISTDSLPIFREASFGSGLVRSPTVGGVKKQVRTTGLELYYSSDGGYLVSPGIFRGDSTEVDIGQPDYSRCKTDMSGKNWQYRMGSAGVTEDLKDMKNCFIPGVTELVDDKGKLASFCGLGGYHWPDGTTKDRFGGVIAPYLEDPLADIHPWLAIYAYNVNNFAKQYPDAAAGHSATPLSLADLKQKFKAVAPLKPSIYWDFDLTSDKTTKDYVRMRGFATGEPGMSSNVAGMSCVFERLPRH